jgi:predicted nucleic acid-binding protein
VRGFEEARGFIVTPSAWLRVLAASSTEPFPGPAAAETAAIALAAGIQAGLLIFDGYRGRKTATERGPRVVGTIGVLGLAAEPRLIDLKGAFERVKETGFWIGSGPLDERLAHFLRRQWAP